MRRLVDSVHDGTCYVFRVQFRGAGLRYSSPERSINDPRLYQRDADSCADHFIAYSLCNSGDRPFGGGVEVADRGDMADNRSGNQKVPSGFNQFRQAQPRSNGRAVYVGEHHLFPFIQFVLPPVKRRPFGKSRICKHCIDSPKVFYGLADQFLLCLSVGDVAGDGHGCIVAEFVLQGFELAG